MGNEKRIKKLLRKKGYSPEAVKHVLLAWQSVNLSNKERAKIMKQNRDMGMDVFNAIVTTGLYEALQYDDIGELMFGDTKTRDGVRETVTNNLQHAREVLDKQKSDIAERQKATNLMDLTSEFLESDDTVKQEVQTFAEELTEQREAIHKWAEVGRSFMGDPPPEHVVKMIQTFTYWPVVSAELWLDQLVKSGYFSDKDAKENQINFNAELDNVIFATVGYAISLASEQGTE